MAERRIFHLIETRTFFTREEAHAAFVARLDVYPKIPGRLYEPIALKIVEVLAEELVP